MRTYIISEDKLAEATSEKGYFRLCKSEDLNPNEILLFCSKRDARRSGLRDGMLVETNGYKRLYVNSTFAADSAKPSEEENEREYLSKDEIGDYYFNFFCEHPNMSWLKFNFFKSTISQKLDYKIGLDDSKLNDSGFLFRLMNKMIGCGCMLHRTLSNRLYFRNAVKKKVLSSGVVELTNGGKTGALYLKDSCDGMEVFFKANDYFPYRGIRNEIGILHELIDRYPTDGWYLRYVDADSSKGWVMYPFRNSFTLADILFKRSFSDEDLKYIGNRMLEMLDKLYEVHVSHNDFRPENILVDFDECGKVNNITLIDFGCASCDDRFPWKKNNIFGKYFLTKCAGKYRYSDFIIDDAAAAEMIFCQCGGERFPGLVEEFRKRIGRAFVCKTCNGWHYIRERK